MRVIPETLLQNAELILSVLTIFSIGLTALLKKLGISIDGNTVKEACVEAYRLYKSEADGSRQPDGSIMKEVGERILAQAVRKARIYLDNKKPKWLPGFIWNWGLAKITDDLLVTIIEGIVEQAKRGKLKTT